MASCARTRIAALSDFRRSIHIVETGVDGTSSCSPLPKKRQARCHGGRRPMRQPDAPMEGGLRLPFDQGCDSKFVSMPGSDAIRQNIGGHGSREILRLVRGPAINWITSG